MKVAAAIPAVLLGISLAPAVFAQHERFTANPDASQVTFALNGSGHHVQGVFHVQSGTIDFDPSTQSISGSIIVAAGSGNSGEPSRDKKMNSDVLNSDQFAEISFAPNKIEGALSASGDSRVQISGTFTLHGTPHDLTIPMQIHVDGSSLSAKGHFVVPYVQWGLKDPSVFILKVAKQVDIDLSFSGNISPAT